MLCLILGIFVAIASDATHNYHVAIVGFLAAGIILTSSSANNIMYTTNSAREAAAAGFILLSIVNVRQPYRYRPHGDANLEPDCMDISFCEVRMETDAS
jgi:hypothetical protein